MAGPSVVVRFLGDLRGLGASMQAAGSSAQSAASRAQAGFGRMLGTLNASGALGPFGTALAGMNDAIGSVIENGKKVGPAMLGAGAAVTGVGALLSSLGSKEQASHQQLKAAIEATGGSYDEFGAQIEKTIKHQENFGHTSAQTQDAIRILTQATGNTSTALKYMNTVSDLAAAKHISLDEAATKLGKAYNGNSRILKEFGITVTKTSTFQAALTKATTAANTADKTYATAKQRLATLEVLDASKKKLTTADALKLRDAENRVYLAALASQQAHQHLAVATDNMKSATANAHSAVDQLGKKLAGQASAQADTFGGRMSALKAKLEDQISTFGQKYGPALQAAGIALMALGTVSTVVGPLMGSMMTIALGPIGLIILGIAALIAAAYLLYRNWSTVWGAIQAVIGAVWNWIKTNWPLLLGILLGPVALAVVGIAKYWDQIKAAVSAVVQWIKGHWQLLVAILTGPVGVAIYLIARYWSTLEAVVAGVINWIKGAWNGFVGFVAGLPGRIGQYLGGVFNAAIGAAGSAIGWVETQWNNFIGFLAGIPGRVAGALGNMWSPVWNGFKSAVNLVIRGWDALHLNLGGWKVGAGPFSVTLPTITVGLPYIPQLQTGGLITSAGVAYLHPGETVTPAGSAGPTLHIENATFVEPVDVDVLEQRLVAAMRRAS